MRKIVIKVKVRGRDEFEEKVTELGHDFGPLYWQHDRVYVPRGYKRGQNYPRFIMRTEMKAIDRPANYFLIFKRHIEDTGIELENMTMIKDYAEAVEMIMQLGFMLQKEVSRKRQDVKISNETKLYLDKVEGVSGVFAKIEAEIPEDKKIVEVRNEAREFFEKVGEKNFYEKTYAELLN